MARHNARRRSAPVLRVHHAARVGLALLALGACSSSPSPTAGDVHGDALGGDAVSGDAATGGDTWASEDVPIPAGLKSSLEDERVIGPAGGKVSAADQGIVFTIPAGALKVATTVRLLKLTPSKTDTAEGDPWTVTQRHYRIEPTGIALQPGANVAMKLPAWFVTHKVANRDLGVYRRGEAGWTLMAMAPSDAPVAVFANDVAMAASCTRTGEIAARLHPQGAFPPSLTQVGISPDAPISDSTGAKVEVGATGALSIWGFGFGWQTQGVGVEIGSASFAPHFLTHSHLSVNYSVGDATETQVRQLRVRVGGRVSDTLDLKIQAIAGGKPVIDLVHPVGGTAAGRKVRMRGSFPGAPIARRVLLGDTELVPKADVHDQLWVQIPKGHKPGATTLRVIDGAGGPPSDAVPYVVYADTPPALGVGAEGGGVWLPPRANNDAGEPVGPRATLLLDALNVPPRLNDYDVLEVRMVGGGVDVGWQTVDLYSNEPQSCFGNPTGLCALNLPPALADALEPGDVFELQLRHTHRFYPDGVPPDAAMKPEVWTGPLLKVSVAGRAWPGGVVNVPVGDAGTSWSDKGCQPELQPFNVGDVVCLTPAACPGSGCAPYHQVSAPGLWSGAVVFQVNKAPNGPHRRGAAYRCRPLTQPGTLTVSNQTLGTSCTIDVVAAGGQLGNIYGKIGDGSQAVAVQAGGAQLVIPAGALPQLPAGQQYTVEWTAPKKGDPNNPPVSTGDPAQASPLGAYRLKVLPEPKELLKPVQLAVPVDPAAGPEPSLGLAAAGADVLHDLGATLSGLAGQAQKLITTLPAGGYGAPSTKPKPGDKPIAVPAPFNTAVAKITVAYHSTEPGSLKDAKGRFVVSWVPDPKSKHHVPKAYAVATLDAADKAWTVLAGLGWKEPKGPIALSIRETVSWASSTAKGATTAGAFGQPAITIRSDLSDPAARAYVIAHEVGHLFQRQYTTNLTLSWFDEAAAEWAAWKVVGASGFPSGGMTGDQDAIRVVMAGLPDSFGGVNKAYVYGSAAWTLWLAEAHGDATLRKAYEALDWSPSYWISAHKTLNAAAGKPVGTLLHDFAEAFWLNAYPAVETLSWTAGLLALGWQEKVVLHTDNGADLSLPVRPATSSRRWRLIVSDADAQALAVGDVVFRVAGLGDQAEVSIWHQGKFAADPNKPTLIARLDDKSPAKVVSAMGKGVWWLLHNRWATSGTGKGGLSVELPRVLSLSPSSAKAGQTVVVGGVDLGVATGKLIVGGQQVVASGAWKPNQVRFVMPSFANTSAVTVAVVTADGAKSSAKLLQVVK